MKDFSTNDWERSPPIATPLQAIDFCLSQLDADRRHKADDVVAGVCTFKELIGALLLARDEIEQNVPDARAIEEYAAANGLRK
jgi:hypothetical protein